MSTVVKDLGAVSAYAYAVEKGYTGTEAEFAELMADYAEVGQRAEDAAESALNSKTAAQTAATTATNKASEATTAAQTATTKAAEAQADADAAALDASQALSAASTATTKATEATTAAATATSAKTDAVAANTAAQSAKTAAQTAQTGAETAAASVEASAAQIATNAEDISQLKSELTTKADLDELYKAFPTDTASGAVASFADGANVPVKSLIVNIDPVQGGSGDPSPDNVRPISGHTQAVVTRTGKNLLNPDISSWRLRETAYRYINNVVPKGQTARFTFTDKDTSVSVSGISLGFVYNDLSSSLPLTYTWVLNNGSLTMDVSNVAINGNIGAKCQNVLIYPQSEEAFNAVFARYNVMVELGTTASEYEPYQGETISVSWESEAGTVYGGTLDVLSGELVIDRAMVDLESKTFTKWVNDNNTFVCAVPGISTTSQNITCNTYAPLINGGITWGDILSYDMTIYHPLNYMYLLIRDTRYTDATAFNTAMSGVQLVYPLATPITVTLTPNELSTLLGANNIWSDAGEVTAEYRADPTLFIQRKIAEALS